MIPPTKKAGSWGQPAGLLIDATLGEEIDADEREKD